MAETLGSLTDKLTISNIKLWHLEETKHSKNENDQEVARVARLIGTENKKRNALIDEIDRFNVEAHKGKMGSGHQMIDPKNKLY